MGCNIPLANNACSAELDSFSTQVISSAIGILAKKNSPGATIKHSNALCWIWAVEMEHTAVVISRRRVNPTAGNATCKTVA